MELLTGKHLSRRVMLKGMGASVALPMLDVMIPAARRLSEETTEALEIFSHHDDWFVDPTRQRGGSGVNARKRLSWLYRARRVAWRSVADLVDNFGRYLDSLPGYTFTFLGPRHDPPSNAARLLLKLRSWRNSFFLCLGDHVVDHVLSHHTADLLTVFRSAHPILPRAVTIGNTLVPQR